jgi:hypothetical protein
MGRRFGPAGPTNLASAVGGMASGNFGEGGKTGQTALITQTTQFS